MTRQRETPGGRPGATAVQPVAVVSNPIVPQVAPVRNPLCAAALDLAQRGYRIIPCKPRAKSPLTQHGVKEATTDKRTIEQWWAKWPDANIGLSCAGLLVLDVDGPDGQEALRGKHLPPTPCARTGAGLHYYFRAPSGVTLKNRVRVCPGVDVRADGGYVIAPPSVHPNGRPYVWAEGLSLLDLDPAPCPQWLVDLCADTRPNSQATRYGAAALTYEAERVAQAQRGTRNDTLNRAAFALGQLMASGDITAHAVHEALVAACKTNGLWAEDPNAVKRTIASGLQAGRAQPRDEPTVDPAVEEDLPQADVMVNLALAEADLFRDHEGERWCTLPTPEGQVTFALADRGGGGLRDWLARRYREATGRTPNATALAMATLQVAAECAVAPVRQVALRVAECDGAIWLDLGDSDGQVVRITPMGWEITQALPSALRFRRPPGMQALPWPVSAQGRGLKSLRQHVNLQRDEDWVLLVGWLLCALRPGYPYPVLVLVGEQGSAKSTTARLLRFLVDPLGEDGTGLTRLPRDDRDLFAIARNCHIVAIDNITSLPTELSDSLSALATGAGLQARRLYTDSDITATWAKRPIILNGIGAAGSDIAARPDLLDRAFCVNLAPIPDENRRNERDLWADIRAIAPQVLADLLNAMACALDGVDSVRGPLPRMADAAAWVTAAEPALGWPSGTFVTMYAANRAEAIEALLDADPLAPHLRELAAEGWQGTVSDLLRELDERAPETERRRKGWPGSADALGKRLTRLAPALRRSGVQVDREKGAKGIRTVVLRQVP